MKIDNSTKFTTNRNMDQSNDSRPSTPDSIVKEKDNNGNENGDSNSSKEIVYTEVLAEPVEELGGERITWEYHNVILNRVPGYGFGIAVSGGRDNPHFANGDPAIAISDVLRAGPAEGKLQVNDRVISANRISLENVDYATAVQVLRDSGSSVELVIKRRVVLPPSNESQTYRVTLTKSRKKDDFGLVLGCKLYIKEAANRNLVERDGNIHDGDIITKINNTSTESMTLKEAKKMIENCKEKLHLVLKRDSVKSNNTDQQHNNLFDNVTNNNKDQNFVDVSSDNRQHWTNQNLYVQPPTRADRRPPPDDKLNLSDENSRLSAGRSRGPLMDISLSQLDQPATPLLHGHGHSRAPIGIDEEEPPPRPPPPRSDDYLGRRDLYNEDPLANKNKVPLPDPRFISFQKDGSVGIRLTGGNEVGIFVTAVQPGSPASLQGLQPGDRLIKVNEKEMKGVTREDAVLYLLNLQDQIHLIVQYRKEEYDTIVANQKGDSFYVRAHFTYDNPGKGEMSFHTGDVFHVIDTLHNGVVGAWQVYRIGRHNQETQKGIIPNRSRAEELAQAQHSQAKKDASSSESRGSFFKRRSARRSKSLCKDHWDDIVFSDSISKFSAYERVTLKHPGFVRPAVLFGPMSDVLRDKLQRESPEKFGSPQLDSQLDDVPKSQKSSGIVRLSAIKEIVSKSKHAVLDITPNAVDRLNYAQFYPIVIFLKAESKQVIKELRHRFAKSSHKSSKKLYDHSVKLERLWSHIFTATISLTSSDSWYQKVRDTIEKQQQSEIWMSEAKPEENISDDFLFPMTSRLSYASSPESDLDLTCDSRPTSMHDRDNSSPRTGLPSSPRLVKSSSDPSIATQEDTNQPINGGIPNYNQPPPYSVNPHRQEQVRIEDDDPGRRESLSNKRNIVENGFNSPYYSHDANKYYNRSPYNQINGMSPSGRYGVVNGEPPVGEGPEPYSPKPRAHPPNNDQPDVPPPPPKIDRANKPSQFKTAQEMLFGNQNGRVDVADHGSSNYINASPNKSISLDRDARPPLPPGVGYDSSSFSSDSYNKHTINHHKQVSMGHDDRRSNRHPSHPRTTSYENYHTARLHDPYRFTRSTAQPVGSQKSIDKQRHPDIPHKYRSPPEENRPMPPPKPASYQPRLPDGKPVPPPKPNSYRSTTMERPWRTSNGGENYNNRNYPQSPPEAYHNRANSREHVGGAGEYNQSPYYTPTKSHHQTNESRYHNNYNKYQDHDVVSNGCDSGHGTGSSIDRHNFMAQMTTPPRNNSSYHQHHNNNNNNNHSSPESSGLLDLSNRENRGSAFELYRKPDSSRFAMSPSHNYHSLVGYGADGMMKRLSLDSNGHCVIDKAKGIFTSVGGTLKSDDTGVSLIVPPDSIPEGVSQEIYFKVCQDTSMMPPLDADKGETLLSPLVMCGPHGLQFEKPVELHLPHSGVNPENWSFALKSSDANAGADGRWKNISLDDQTSKQEMESNFVTVTIDHF